MTPPRSKDAINRRLYKNQSFVLTAIYRVSCLNRTVLIVVWYVPNLVFWRQFIVCLPFNFPRFNRL
ncbi:hypothetical protein LC613_27290 [Nostoc sphaeroides CHAB 2801]|uniref:hypothetical protein n=1 Tax=Nostoc sphaeroides TaxID=446679 RepID=UPI00126A684F|nr:hypothetical protein [Nostoc sphaeroides]MCC5631461.1 hypothetical protein [Nostoc sphaeroides CHAB 2801]